MPTVISKLMSPIISWVPHTSLVYNMFKEGLGKITYILRSDDEFSHDLTLIILKQLYN